jgi:hypothetical protein
VALQASDPYAKRGPVPKKKAAPKRKKVAPKRPSGAGIAGVSVAVAKRQTTPKKVVARTRKAGRPAPRRAPVDPIDAILAKYDRIDDESRRGAQPEREVETGGPDLSRLQLLAAEGGGNTIGGFLKNLGRGGVDVLTSVPASAQLVAEAAAYPVVAAVNVARGERPGPKGGRDSGIGQRVEAKLEEDLRAAGTGVKKDYAYRYGPLFSGDVGEFGSRFYDDPLPTILDVAGAKSIIGRSPNAVSRVARAVAPETKIGMRAARNLSTLSGADRAAMAQVTGRKIAPGAGGRYRAPQRLRTQVARPEPGKPAVGIREVEIPRRPYSGDAIARARQKAVDKTRAKAGARLERAAESRQRAAMPKGSRQAGMRERATARALRRFTPEGKIANLDKRSTLDLQDLFDAKAEVNRARNMPGAAKAIAQLKPDKNVAGQTIPGLSVEEAAFAVHRMDMLGDVVKGKRVRGGLSANDLLDRYIRTVEGNQRAARAAGKRTENAAQQLQSIKALRERPELLELTDMKNPAVRRVAQAVEESRRLGRIYQAQAVKSGIITNKTRKAAAMRDSAIGVGGARWGADEIRKVTVAARRKTLGIKKAIVRAEKRGDAVEVKRLKRELSSHIKATKGRVAAVKRDATRDTDFLRDLRKTDTDTMTAAAKKRHFARIRKAEREALGFTSPRRPELVGKRGVYVPDKRIDVTEGYTGPKPGGRFSGPDKARKSTGSLKSRAGQDLNPNLVLHQAARASENYTGRISAQALDELMKTAAYIDPTTGKALTGNRLRLLSQADSERVRLVHAGNLRKALKKLDELEEGKFLDDATVRQVFTDRLPEGARASDYVAISKDAADVWTEAMTRYPLVDKALNYWKGGILALSPRWYVNNTFGLALQYSVMTGGDFKALARANRHAPQIRRAMEKRFPNLVKDTMAADLTGGMDMPRLINFGFRTNAKLEEFWRRGAAYNRLKRAIRDEGGRFRKMTDAEVSDAIMRMPEAKIAEIVRDVEFFIGNYRKFNKLERNWIKRVIPFYSWMRVISRLTFALPFRSPVRAAALTLLETASTAGINPNDKSLPYYARGAIRPGGNIAVPTWGLNPWQTMAGAIVAAGEESPSGALAQEALGWMHPGAQLFTERATGINNFGRGVITPPGEAPFGQDPSNYNPIGAGISRQAPRIPFKEALLQSAFPGQVQVLRKMSQGNRQAFDQTETPDLLIDFLNRMAGGERDESLYAEEKKGPRGRRQSDLNAITAWFGIPTYRQDDAAIVREAKKQQAKYLAELRKRKQARAKR